MWLTTTRGFYSAVAHRNQPDQLLIRARDRGDLERLIELLDANPEIIDTPEADYPCRIYLHREVWAQVVAQLLTEIDYGNFKDAVKVKMPGGERRASTYIGAWAAFSRIESENEPPPPADPLWDDGEWDNLVDLDWPDDPGPVAA